MVRVPELTNAVVGGLVASCAPAAVMPLSAGLLWECFVLIIQNIQMNII